MSKKQFKLQPQEAMDKRQKDGYIVPDRRLILDFNMHLHRGNEVVTRRCYTRADTIKEAEKLVASVAASLVKEDGWDSFDIEMAA